MRPIGRGDMRPREVILQELPASLVCIVLFLTILSGLASYVNGVRVKQFDASILAFIGEMASSIIAGLAVMFLGAWQQYPPALTCLFSLAAANNGKEFMGLISQIVKHKIGSISGGSNGRN